MFTRVWGASRDALEPSRMFVGATCRRIGAHRSPELEQKFLFIYRMSLFSKIAIKPAIADKLVVENCWFP